MTDQKKQVLLLDECTDRAMCTKFLLNLVGCEVIRAAEISEALNWLNTPRSFDLLIVRPLEDQKRQDRFFERIEQIAVRVPLLVLTSGRDLPIATPEDLQVTYCQPEELCHHIKVLFDLNKPYHARVLARAE